MDEGLASAHSGEMACPYFGDGRISRIEYCRLHLQPSALFDFLLARGYRRIGSVFYRTACGDCSACVPIRLDVERFSPRKGQRRTMRLNAGVRVSVGDSVITDEKVALYRSYLASKHGVSRSGGDRDHEMELSAVHYGYAQTLEMDYYLDGRLVGVGIVDEGARSLSSNYFYYDTSLLQRRLGVFSILNEISLARLLGKKYYYLGYYIEETPKMSYKKFFRPNEIYQNGQWSPFIGL
jgi:arginine-tRNA-protein transferase